MAAEDQFEDTALGKALQKRKQLQETIKTALQELKKIEDWLQMHRELSTGYTEQKKGVEIIQPTLRVTGEMGMENTQDVFETLVLAVLRDIGRPMRSPELIEEFRKRGHPMPRNAVRTAWNRLWKAKTRGVLISLPKLGYWITGEPLSEEAREQALIAGKRRNNAGVSALIEAARGKKKGRAELWGPEEVATAERMLLAGKSRIEVAAALGGVSQSTIQKYFPGGIGALKKKYPDIAIPKRAPVPQLPRSRPKSGRPRLLTEEQDRQIAELRTQGNSINKIAFIMGLKSTTVYSSVRRNEKRGHRAKDEAAN
jgi:transposase